MAGTVRRHRRSSWVVLAASDAQLPQRRLRTRQGDPATRWWSALTRLEGGRVCDLEVLDLEPEKVTSVK